MATGERSVIASAVFRQAGQVSIGPSGVPAQSRPPIRVAHSPPPDRKTGVSALAGGGASRGPPVACSQEEGEGGST
jgi:hypothetical protein